MKALFGIVSSLALGLSIGSTAMIFKQRAEILELQQTSVAIITVLENHQQALQTLVNRANKQSEIVRQ